MDFGEICRMINHDWLDIGGDANLD